MVLRLVFGLVEKCVLQWFESEAQAALRDAMASEMRAAAFRSRGAQVAEYVRGLRDLLEAIEPPPSVHVTHHYPPTPAGVGVPLPVAPSGKKPS